ncbi:hypothetical protein HDV63DRAFT_82755 [Trichoderma sp. SZMC 28014]
MLVRSSIGWNSMVVGNSTAIVGRESSGIMPPVSAHHHPSVWPKGRTCNKEAASTCPAVLCVWRGLVVGTFFEARKKKAADGKPCSLNVASLLLVAFPTSPAPTTGSSSYQSPCPTNAAPIQHTYAHVHSPAVSYCSVSAQGLVHFSPKPSVLAPSLRLHAACLRTATLVSSKLFQLINCPASGAQIGLVPFLSLSRLCSPSTVLFGSFRHLAGASCRRLSLIRTFINRALCQSSPALGLGRTALVLVPNFFFFLTSCYSPFTTPEKACPSIECVEPEICNIPRHCDTGIASSSRAALTHRVLAGAVAFLLSVP